MSYPVLQSLAEGAVVEIGRWRGDPLVWQFLGARDNLGLFITKNVIERIPYNSLSQHADWETCSLRYWCNHVFFDNAFNDVEKGMITVKPPCGSVSPFFNIAEVGTADDAVFCLSLREANYLFSDDNSRRAESTPAAKEQGLYEYEGYSLWWLRSSSEESSCAPRVESDGKIGRLYPVGVTDCGVRPVIWVALK